MNAMATAQRCHIMRGVGKERCAALWTTAPIVHDRYRPPSLAVPWLGADDAAQLAAHRFALWRFGRDLEARVDEPVVAQVMLQRRACAWPRTRGIAAEPEDKPIRTM